MALGVLVDAPSQVIDHTGAELHDVEGVQDGGGVVELVIDGVLVPAEGVQGRHLHPVPENFFPRAFSQVL